MNEDDRDVCILPPTIHGWSFRAKKWGGFLIDDLSEIQFDEDAFGHLVLREDYKQLVLAFAEAHMQKDSPLLKDIMKGKGGGIVMLLHGKPG
jgi:hypothetical protein